MRDVAECTRGTTAYDPRGTSPSSHRHGLVGPLIISMVKDSTGSYSQTLYVFAGFFVIALIVSILMIANIRKIKKANS